MLSLLNAIETLRNNYIHDRVYCKEEILEVNSVKLIEIFIKELDDILLTYRKDI